MPAILALLLALVPIVGAAPDIRLGNGPRSADPIEQLRALHRGLIVGLLASARRLRNQ
jgi:hypothetical protein